MLTTSRRIRLATAVVAVALVGAACSGRDDVTTDVTSAVDGNLAVAAATRQAQVAPTPGPTATTTTSTAGVPLSASVLDEVAVLDPRVQAKVAPGAPQGELLRVSLVEGVTGITGFARFDATLVSVTQDRVVDVVAVDPISFRPMTPEVTAQVPELWERLHEGNVLVRHDVAHELDLELGGTYLLEVDGVAHEVRIGAFASNGAPPVAEVVVPWSFASLVGRSDVTDLLVGLAPEASARRVSSEINETVDGVEAEPREGPSRFQASLRGSTVAVPAFNYVDLGDGMIVIDAAWVREWIVVVDLPHLGRTRTNRLMVEPLTNVLNDLQAQGLLHLLRPEEFAGSWVPRHIDWNPTKPLSWHAWGLAIDVNSHSNPLGARPTLDARIVETFERWGFRWGGRWSRPDGMHFELDRVVSSGG